MDRLVLIFTLLLCSCSTLMTAGSAAGGAALGSLAGPAGAAIGAVGGVVAVELLEGEVPEIIADSPASTIHETTSLVEAVGLWYLLLFVLVPFLSKRGRTWIKKFTDIHNTVSQSEIDMRAGQQDARILSLEQKIDDLKKQVE